MRWPEIREVKNPVSPAVAFTEHGRTVVEVDEALKGKARAVAIWAAVRLHERGLAALAGLPVLAFAWDPLKRWAHKHVGQAMAATAATGSLLTAGAAFVLPVILDDAPEPKIAEPPPVILTSAPTSPAQTLTTTGKPTRKPTGSATVNQDRPGTDLRPAARPATRPVRTPTRSTHPRPTTSVKPTETEIPSTPDPTPQGLPADPPPTTAAATPPPDNEASDTGPPAPAPAAAEGCLLRVDVDPLLEVCALG